MDKKIVNRLNKIENRSVLGLTPTRMSMTNEVRREWNTTTFGDATEAAVRPFVEHFLRIYEGHRENGSTRTTALCGARAFLAIWMRLTPDQLRARCEHLWRNSRRA